MSGNSNLMKEIEELGIIGIDSSSGELTGELVRDVVDAVKSVDLNFGELAQERDKLRKLYKAKAEGGIKMRTKFNQNWAGVYTDSDGSRYKCVTTMTRLTVKNAPVWFIGKHGKWVRSSLTVERTVGVTRPKDFDFEAMLAIAVGHPKAEMSAVA